MGKGTLWPRELPGAFVSPHLARLPFLLTLSPFLLTLSPFLLTPFQSPFTGLKSRSWKSKLKSTSGDAGAIFTLAILPSGSSVNVA